tara:strand:- start:20644 stop:21333 length:690 start_codon:yes stop_codon:yes gene_type:complete
MSTFDLLEKRHHVRFYKDDVPPKDKIEFALWQAWKTSPSKNNAMPWKVIVYGPEHKEEKIKVWKMVAENHKDAEKRAMQRGEATRTESGKPNPYYEHIKSNPYLFCIHAQPRNPNKFYEKQVEEGMFFDQAWPSRVHNFIDTSAVEVGMFIQNLSSYLLEQNIDVSYTSCFFREIEKWHDIGLKDADYRPIVLMSAGYSELYRYEMLRSYGREKEDIKPEYEEIIKWKK